MNIIKPFLIHSSSLKLTKQNVFSKVALFLILKKNINQSSYINYSFKDRHNHRKINSSTSTSTCSNSDLDQSKFEPRFIKSVLKFQNGREFNATSFGAELTKSPITGEVVFTTALVGYPESMTDPSYRNQILVFTQPLIGNYGVPSKQLDEFGLLKHFESDKIQVKGIIVNNYATTYSHWNAIESLGQWCAREGIPALFNVDTRSVVSMLRENGSTIGQILIGDKLVSMKNEKSILSQMNNLDYSSENLVAQASCKEVIKYSNLPTGSTYDNNKKLKIALIDCGVKQNIIRSILKAPIENLLPSSNKSNLVSNDIGASISTRKLLKQMFNDLFKINNKSLTFDKLISNYKGIEVYRVPYNHDFRKDVTDYDGYFISNGPGNPENVTELVSNLRYLMNNHSSGNKIRPIMGICMGHQLLGLAAGFKSYKLKYGNRGHNQPAVNLITKDCVITSQNHGFALDDSDISKIPQGWIPYFRNANDFSNEGICHKFLPFSSVQFHPEAVGGPLDTNYLFQEFVGKCLQYKFKNIYENRSVENNNKNHLGSIENNINSDTVLK